MNKYTEELKKILKCSELIALENNDDYVDSIHFFISILSTNNSVNSIMNDYFITKETILPYLSKGKSNNKFVMYSKEILEAIESIILESEEMSDEITSNKLLIKLLENNKSKCSAILNELNVDKTGLLNSLYKINDSNKKLTIKEIAIDLNEAIKNKEIDKVYGREKEIERIIEILARKNKNNPILIGEAGVGKTALVEELARRIVEDDVPLFLKNKTILSLNLASVIAGTKYRGEFEEKLTKIIKELESTNNLILFIDEIHTIIGAGGAEGAIDASNILKPALARGKIKLIGATTLNEYKLSIEKDKALDRRFQKVIVNEPSIKETTLIIKNIKKDYEKYHNVIIRDSIINTLVKLSNKYIKDRHEPDKSIDILDEMCAKTNIINSKNNTFKKLDKLKKMKKNYLLNNNYKEASKLLLEIDNLNNKLSSKNSKNNIVSLNTLKSVLESKCMSKIYELEDKKYLNDFNSYLKNNILYQDKVIDNLTNIVNEIFSNYKTKPISICICGKKGSGKTLLTDKVIEYFKFKSIKLDGKDYTNSLSLNKIIGSPAGYVGYNEKNTIFESIKTYPNTIIVVDNLDFINIEIKNIIDNILIDGKLKLSNNEEIDFNSTIFLFNNVIDENSIGFVNSNKKNITNNRDYTLYLNDYSKDEIKSIIKFKYPNILIDNKLLEELDYKNNNLRKLESVVSDNKIHNY